MFDSVPHGDPSNFKCQETLFWVVQFSRKIVPEEIQWCRLGYSGGFPELPKGELEDLGFSGIQVVPTTRQPLQVQPVRRVIHLPLPSSVIGCLTF